MKTVTGKLVSTKPISLSNAAKYISRFYSSDNGASTAVDVFLERATKSFDSLVALHKQLKSSRRREDHSIDADTEAVGAPGEIPEGEKAEKRERKGKGKVKNDGLEVKNEEIVKNEQSPDGIAGKKRKKGKKSEDFEQKTVENEVIVKTEGSPDGVVEKKRKKRKNKVVDGVGDEEKQEIVDGGGLENALVDGGALEKKDEKKKEETKEGGKKRKHREAVVGEDVKNIDMADDQSGKKKKKKRRIEGEGQ